MSHRNYLANNVELLSNWTLSFLGLCVSDI